MSSFKRTCSDLISYSSLKLTRHLELMCSLLPKWCRRQCFLRNALLLIPAAPWTWPSLRRFAIADLRWHLPLLITYPTHLNFFLCFYYSVTAISICWLLVCLIRSLNLWLGTVVHGCNPSTREAETRGTWVSDQPGLHPSRQIPISKTNKQTKPPNASPR
jgi:hypothetical protein